MSSSDLALSVRGLSKSYTIAHQQGEKHSTLAESLLAKVRRPFRRAEKETFWALKDVSFDIKKGDVVGIIGRNGAGKSTLLKILSRITEPTTGEIDVYGRIGSLLEVGTGFHPELTGRENVFLNGAILGMNKAEIRKQFDAIVDFAGVEQFLDTPVKRYSSGMYVRLAFAVAAHLESEVLIVDEVLAVGDSEFQQKCLGKMKDVSSHGRTVLFVSHNLAAVKTLCDRGIVLTSGHVADFDATERALATYRTLMQKPETILKKVRVSSPRLRIDGVLVNGTTDANIELPYGDTQIQIDVFGEFTAASPCSLEITLSDENDIPVAFYGQGHFSGISGWMPRGHFRVSKTLRMPPTLHAGSYWLSIDLANHNVDYLMRCGHAVLLSHPGTPTKTGSTIAYTAGKGYLSLDEVNRELVNEPNF